jgi:L-lactate dehydrogenase complex protein LldE
MNAFLDRNSPSAQQLSDSSGMPAISPSFDPFQVELFVPCFIDQIYPETGFQCIKILEKAGCRVHYDPKQTCCGQPACNAGYWAEAWPISQNMVKRYAASNRPLIAPSASCVGFIRGAMAELLKDSDHYSSWQQLASRTFELSEYLVDVLKVEDLGASFASKASYHDACAALRECKIKEAPRKLLANVDGLELIEMEDAEVCCGFGGSFSFKFEPISTGMGDHKLKMAEKAEADTVISTDLSCLMHLQSYANRQNQKIRFVHLAEVLSSF